MKKALAVIMFGAIVLTSSSYAQNPPAVTTNSTAPTADAPAPPAPSAMKSTHKEHHPELHKAMRKLKGAKSDLEKAASDYDGHKAKAIELINQAIDELKAAAKSDKK